ncbi:aldehyde dehydrogenase [Plectosphaerella plurivora]|uniref:Succinate-semialdehyde dehydrogenase, mitochondrial n=1 Tax=Plectosphaerella plurivora TaxID=936078 RepID=A0A9P8VDF3_9PEZI|nr:aldehyde dehydrogenase [Plectosphaerella plurivora]
MITRKVAPAIAAGCSVVLKSPGETPLAALALAELGHRAGIPKGIINVVSALENTAEVGRVISTHPTIKKLSFTGSTPVGKLLMEQASSTLKKLSFELGGNAAFIIFDDADLDLAVSCAVTSKFRSSGQTCVCANRIFVHEQVYDEFARRFVDRVSKVLQVGDGSTAGVTLGPLIHGRAVDKVESHVVDAKAKGGKVILGGQRIPELGPNFFQPTVITGMTHDMAMAREETFGPVAGLFKFRTEKEVVTLANSVDVGLAAYIFSKDIQRVGRVSEALKVGMVGVNTGLVSDVAAPFGSVKESGFGREGSKWMSTR